MTASSVSEPLTQLRRGVLELCILQLLASEPSYGYEIVARLHTFVPLAAGPSTIYPLLRRLKADGHLATFLGPSPTGPPRQYYRVTAGGRSHLVFLRAEWNALNAAVSQVTRKGAVA